jgi:tRNA 2-thiouridine synthesizing protein A
MTEVAVQVLNTLGLKRPQPTVRIALKAADMKPGDILEILGDSPCFERDVRTWCERLRKHILFVRNEVGNKQRIRIRV